MQARKLGIILTLMAASFSGGAVFSHVSHATTRAHSPYSPLSQLANVLVFMENKYVDPVERQKILDGAIKGMVSELDPHSAYMNPQEFALFNEDTEGVFGGIGVEVDFKYDYVMVIAPIPNSPAARGGILSGDMIVAVDGKPLRGLPVDKVVGMMRGPAKTQVTVSIRREGQSEPLHIKLTREHIQVTSVEAKHMDQGIAYIRLKQFQAGTHIELLDAIASLREAEAKPLRGVLLDMRANPGGLVDEAEAVANELLNNGGIYSTRHRGKIFENVRARPGGALTKLPLVVLINEYSASSTELVAGALQDNARAKLFGATTFGKGSVQTIFELPGGAGLRLTTMRYYTPKGRAIQATGVEPDVLIQHRDKHADAPNALREGQLEGHLPAEKRGAQPRAAKVLDGGKRPDYQPINKIPVDPRTGSDGALKIAYEDLLQQLARNTSG